MLENTITARTLAAIVAALAALSLLAVAAATGQPIVGMLGLALVNACAVLVIQHDNAKTRRAVRFALREVTERAPARDMRSVR